MKCITGTDAELDAIVVLVDKALGYPKRGTHVGGGRHVDMPNTWDGKGAVPLGWSRSFESVWVQDSNNTVMRLDDADVALVTGAGSPLTGAEKATVAAKTSARVDLSNFGTRLPKAPAVVAAAQVGAIDAAAAEDVTP